MVLTPSLPVMPFIRQGRFWYTGQVIVFPFCE